MAITLTRNRYSKELYKKEYLIHTLQEYQRQRIDEASIYLSASKGMHYCFRWSGRETYVRIYKPSQIKPVEVFKK
jgi:hypothetical protein